MSTEPRFHIGALVQKSKGYRYPGIIRSRHLMPGGWRYDVEADNPDFKGMLHIFSEEQLELRAVFPQAQDAAVEPDELEILIADRSANRAADAILEAFVLTRR